jgi:hypothetical protein
LADRKLWKLQTALNGYDGNSSSSGLLAFCHPEIYDFSDLGRPKTVNLFELNQFFCASWTYQEAGEPPAKGQQLLSES